MQETKREIGQPWGTYETRRCEGAIDVEQADGVLDGAVLERDDALAGNGGGRHGGRVGGC